MKLALYVAAAALVALSILLLFAGSMVRAIADRFALLDREQIIPRLRLFMTISSALAVVTGIYLFVLAATLRAGGAPPAVAEVSQAAVPDTPRPLDTPERTEAVPDAPTAEPELVRESEAETARMAEPAPRVAEPVAKPVAIESAATPNPPSNGWRPAHIESGGDVTMRSWPNGKALLLLSPGEWIQSNGEQKEQGGHLWQRVRMPDGRSGWVVARFVLME